MKDILVNANFPRTADLRVYHLGVRPGEVANRIATVGSPSRAETLATLLDPNPKPFRLASERGFLTITGRYKSVPISIVSIGMGSPNMDFFVRETRESVNGDMVIIRLGSCGALEDNIPVSSVVVPQRCVQISRNVDFDFAHPNSNNSEPAYRISKPVSADVELAKRLLESLSITKPHSANRPILGGTTSASADSFYSSQGRQTSFYDHNTDLIEQLRKSVQNLSTIEMESFHLYHLAACWTCRPTSGTSNALPPATNAVKPIVSDDSRPSTQQMIPGPSSSAESSSVIRAAAAHMVFASRTSQDFITPEDVKELESWTGEAVLNALVNTDIPDQNLHEEAGAVWEIL